MLDVRYYLTSKCDMDGPNKNMDTCPDKVYARIIPSIIAWLMYKPLSRLAVRPKKLVSNLFLE